MKTLIHYYLLIQMTFLPILIYGQTKITLISNQKKVLYLKQIVNKDTVFFTIKSDTVIKMNNTQVSRLEFIVDEKKMILKQFDPLSIGSMKQIVFDQVNKEYKKSVQIERLDFYAEINILGENETQYHFVFDLNKDEPVWEWGIYKAN